METDFTSGEPFPFDCFVYRSSGECLGALLFNFLWSLHDRVRYFAMGTVQCSWKGWILLQKCEQNQSCVSPTIKYHLSLQCGVIESGFLREVSAFLIPPTPAPEQQRSRSSMVMALTYSPFSRPTWPTN